MHNQKIYYPHRDRELAAKQTQCQEVLYDFNHTRPSEKQKRKKMLNALFAEVGKHCYIEPPLRAAFGIHTHLGKHVYINTNLTLVDDGPIYIGDDVMIGPNVVIATAGHTIDPALRKKKAQFTIPVNIGNNVWLGAASVVLPGVSIGENTVIGAGSVVTKNIPANVVAVGNPCRVLREINEHDRQYYYKNVEIEKRELF